MTSIYTAIVTLNMAVPNIDNDDAKFEDLTDEVLSQLSAYGGTVTADEYKRIQIMATIEATTATDAGHRASTLFAPWALRSIKIEILDSHQLDAWADPEAFLSVTDVARRLDISRQAVLKRIGRGTLPSRRTGHKYAIPAAAVS